MAIHLQFSGDASDQNPDVERIISQQYASALETCHVNLHYTLGRGWRVISAVRMPPGDGASAPGAPLERPGRADMAREVKQVLRKARIPLTD